MRADVLDVLVLGGGLTGLAFAGLLAGETPRRRLAIGVLESGSPPAAQLPPEPGLRVVAASRATRAILEQCGAWQRQPPSRVGPYRRMVAWHHLGSPAGDGAVRFDAADLGVADLGYIVENDVLRRALWQSAGESGAVELMSGDRPASLEREDGALGIRLEGGGLLRARLVVGADGHDSWLRAASGVAASERVYGQRALVAHVASEHPHQNTAWQRFLDDGPLALLPLADGRSSIVWSCADARAEARLVADEAAFDEELTAASGGVLGRLRVTTPRAAFRLAARHADRYSGDRIALIGDAAHRLHPLAGQGVNLGFLDAAVLAETLADHLARAHADPGDPRALRLYERRRKAGNLAAMATMNFLHDAFTSRVPGIARAAGAGLAVVDRLTPLKARLADYAMGRAGDLPRVVRAARFS